MKFLLFVMMVFLVSGCSTSKILTSTEPQQTIYTLRPVASTGQGSAALGRTVEIAMPSLPPGLESDRIALFLDDGQKLDYYAGAKWASPLDELVQDVTRRSINAVLPYVVAVTVDQNIAADYRLQIKVNELQPVYAGAGGDTPSLQANIEFTLLRLPEEDIVSDFTLSKQQALQANRLDGITLGLESLLQEIEREAFLKMDARLRVQARQKG